MDLGLTGKVALVTGGSRGIGREIARRLVMEGCAVSICGRTAETLDRTRAELEAVSRRPTIAALAPSAPRCLLRWLRPTP